MATVDASRRKLDLGRVFGDTFGVIRRQAGPLLAVTFLAGYLPGLAGGYFNSRHLGPLAQTDPFALVGNPIYWVLLAVNVPLTSFLLAFQLQIAIGDLEAERRPLPEVLRLAAGKILPILGAMILVALGFMAGALLFLIPGIILAVMWAVALPATVADTSNPVRALGRSRALTRGNRWRIFGLAMLVWLALLVFQMIVLGVIGAMGMLSGAGQFSLLSVALAVLFNVVVTLVGSVGSAALYMQLRELKGVGGKSVAEVFA